MSPWIKVTASAVCLAALLWWTDAAEVVVQLKGADPAWVALSLLAVTAATFSMAWRWTIVARGFDIHFSFSMALREYYLAQLVNSALPGGITGDVARAVRARRAADLAQATQSVVAERLLGQAAMVAFMLVGFLFAVIVPGRTDWGAIAWAVILVAGVGALVTWLAAQRDGASGRFLCVTLAMMRKPSLIGLGVVTTLCLVFAFYACARAVGVILPVAAWATLVPLVFSAMLIPLSIGGWGWREGAAAALFPIIGAPATSGIATGVTYGIVLLIAVLPAAVILFARSAYEPLSIKGKPDLP